MPPDCLLASMTFDEKWAVDLIEDPYTCASLVLLSSFSLCLCLWQFNYNVLVRMSLNLASLEFIVILECVDSCLSSNLGSFQQFFQVFFPIMHMLVSYGSLSSVYFSLLFFLSATQTIISIDLSTSSLIFFSSSSFNLLLNPCSKFLISATVLFGSRIFIWFFLQFLSLCWFFFWHTIIY